MTWEQIAVEWKEVNGALRTTWAKLTFDDLDAVAGCKDLLIGKIQLRYGLRKEDAERKVDEYLARH